MTVLSIDWDFFFYRDLEAKTMRKVEAADNQGHKREVDLFHFFDWGHNEQYSEVLLNILWVTRWQIFTSAGLDPLHYTGIRPEWGGTPLHMFLENLRKVFDWSNGILEYADSHMFGYRTLERAKYAGSVGYRPHVVHFDAHHDLGYAQSKPRIDCGNWLTHAIQDGLVQSLTVVYPDWRGLRELADSHMPELLQSLRKRAPVEFLTYSDWVQQQAPRIDVQHIMVARSGAWVPPWFDSMFDTFVQELTPPGTVAECIECLEEEDTAEIDGNTDTYARHGCQTRKWSDILSGAIPETPADITPP